MGAGHYRNGKGHRTVVLMAALVLGALLTNGVAEGADGKTRDRVHVRHAPVALTKPGERAGQLQHAPTNLGKLKTKTKASSLQPAGFGVVEPQSGLRLAAIAAPTAPVVTSAPSNPTYDLNASFSFSSPGATSYDCRLDNASFAPCTSPKSYAGPLSAGNHNFRVRARDASGTSAVTLVAWTISRPPAPTITSGPETTTVERTATFTFESSLAGVTFECRLGNASYAACTSPKVYTGLTTGGKTFRVRARNASGTGTEQVYQWTVTNLPAPTITTSPTNPTLARNASFEFSSIAGTTFECRLDGSSFAPCTSPKVYPGPLGFGSHTFRVRAVHPTYGTSAAALLQWTIELRAPTIDSAPAATTTSTSATFTFSNLEPSVTYQCRLDAATFAACTSPITYSSLALGAHTFSVRSLKSGATSAATSHAWSIVLNIPKPVKMRLLLVSADGNETDLPALKAFFDQLGIPYTTMIATQSDLTPAFLASGGTGNFQGVVLTTGNLTHNAAAPGQPENWISAFSAEEWQTLWAYEAEYKVRQVTSYTFPFGLPDDYGLALVDSQDTLTMPLATNLTDAGKAIFPYLNTANPITVTGAWAYLATKRDATVTPLITTANGYVIASTNTYPDGRENLAVTVANNPNLVHSQVLSYGLVNWVTRGVFIGERHVNLGVQVDDLFIDSDMWDVDANSDLTGLRFRLDGGDVTNMVAWQNAIRARPNFGQFRLEFAFNGEGSNPDIWEDDELTPNGDTLTPAVVANQSNFSFVNHTYTHANLDPLDYLTALDEIERNQQTAGDLGFTNYDPASLVQPDISGLTNPAFLQAAFDSGIQYLISDASRPEWANPTPNTGFYATGQPSIVIIPRRANNLFYSLRTQQEWVDEYNWFYCLCSTDSPSPWKFWATPQTYEQILDHESDFLLSYMLRWDIDPWMFHQANLGRYSGGRTLLGDLLEAAFDKYAAVYNLPVRNLTQKQAGDFVAQRMAFNASNVDGTLVPCQGITLSVGNAAKVPLTGVNAGSSESYGGQTISSVQMTPGTPTTIPVSC